MSEDGKNILYMVTQMRRLCGQVSLLLRTADDLVGEKGWEPSEKAGNAVTWGNSSSLHVPHNWIPQYFYRFYENEAYKNVLAFVSVILDNRGDNPNFGRFEEPLLTTGWFDYGLGNKIGRWDKWYCVWHVWIPKRKDDGTLLIADPKKEWPDDKYTFIRVSTLGVPLVSVTSTEDMQSKVIRPLLNGIEKEYK